MMKRHYQKVNAVTKRLAVCVGLTTAPFSVVAQSVEEQVVTQLRAQGFSNITVETTLLRRLRFEAERNGQMRELVINPQTGEVMRDRWISARNTPTVIIPGASDDDDQRSPASGGSSENDDEDENNDDDDKEEDDEEDDKGEEDDDEEGDNDEDDS